jgi:two-component system, NtrC family, C4-dicarboxylate transport sensor histidine kinase DctB
MTRFSFWWMRFSWGLPNIFNNAKDQYNHQKIHERTIKINIYKEERTIYIEIEDNAGGIKPSMLPTLFDPYITSKSTHQGTGIGLHLSKILIEDLMSGTIRAENSKKGAKFTLTLPSQ